MQWLLRQRNILLTVTILSILFVPVFTYAATAAEIFTNVRDVTQSLIKLLIGVGVLVFVVGVLRYAFSKDDASKKTARSIMLWGIIGLTVMVSVWGLVLILNNTLLGGQESNVDLVQPDVDNTATKPTEGQFSGRGGSGTVQGAAGTFASFLNSLIPLLMMIGVLLFIWGVFQYVATDSADKKGKASAYIAWGVVILFVMVSVWGLVNLVGDSIGVDADQGGNTPNIVDVNTESIIKR